MNKKKSENPVSFNIHSYLRIRPLARLERRSTYFHIKQNKKDISYTHGTSYPKDYSFDRVFAEDTQQTVVYANVVKPMIQKVIDGYNCTVFAYGQTGTGKTHTMTGTFDERSPRDSPEAGIIPRALDDIFCQLAALNQEYIVTITYVELYCEKLYSLISDEVDIPLLEGADGNTTMRHLRPTPCNTVTDALKLLQMGNQKRQTAATLSNAVSSRSHSIFTITVKIKEPKIDSEELRTAKLHLVDLAGSENITKSGTLMGVRLAQSGQGSCFDPPDQSASTRYKETIHINTSLLTLRKVIRQLLENMPHIGYRESKLTRLLMDSLGGKTMTCIIGTISPAQSNHEESESTLHYTSIARKIINKCVKNATESKKEFMQGAAEQINQLKRDLEANLQKDGCYISRESYKEMTSKIEQLVEEVDCWTQRYSDLSKTYDEKMALYNELHFEFGDTKAELEQAENMIRSQKEKVEKMINEKRQELLLRTYMVQQLHDSRKLLCDEVAQFKSVTETLYEQNKILHDKIDRKTDIERKNMTVIEEVKKSIADEADRLNADIQKSHESQKILLEGVIEKSSKNLENLFDCHNDMKSMLSKLEEGLMQNVANIENACELANDDHILPLKDALLQLKCSLQDTYDRKVLLQQNLTSKIVEDLSIELRENVNELRTVKGGYDKLQQAHVINFNNFKEDVFEKLAEILASAEKYKNTVTVLEDTSKIQSKLQAMARAQLEMTKMLKEVTMDNENLKKSAESSMKDFTETVNNVVDLQKYVSSVENEECDKIYNESSRDTDKVVEFFDRLGDKVEKVKRSTDQEREVIIDVLASSTNTEKLALQKLNESEVHLQNIKSAMKPIGETVEALRTTSNTTVKTLICKMDEYDRNNEGAMRTENQDLISALKVTQTLSETAKCFVTHLEVSTDKGQGFIMDTPTGSTPARMMSKSELRYPSTSHSPPSVDDLIRRIKVLFSSKTLEELEAPSGIGNLSELKQVESRSVEELTSVCSSEYMNVIQDETDIGLRTTSSSDGRMRRSLSLSTLSHLTNTDVKVKGPRPDSGFLE